MSNESLIGEFADFSKKMSVIAILTLLSLTLSIIGAFIPIIGFIALVFDVIIIIYFLLLLGDIKKAGKILNNGDLLAFTPKFLWGTIIRFIGQVLWSIGWLLIGPGVLIPSLIMILIGVGLIIIGSILRYMAWGGLQNFFMTNLSLFPAQVGNDGVDGAKYCKIATIFDMTIILNLIGEIFRIIGYFKMSSWNLLEAPVQPTPQPVTPLPPSVQAPSANYCPSCGSHVGMGVNFCPNCGAEID
ncbi:MAG: zinc ribbon domain-containing protein [Promethearchaeota archaeon]